MSVYRLLEVPGVISIIGGSQQSLAISDSYIDSLRAGIRQGKIEPHPYLTVGMRVRIHSGVMARSGGYSAPHEEQLSCGGHARNDYEEHHGRG